MLIAAVVFILFNSYDSERIALMLSLVVYKILDAVADPLYGVMQRRDRLYFAGISMTIKAVVGFVAFVAVDLATHSMLWASFCLLAANAVFIIVYDIPHVRRLEQIGRLFQGGVTPGLALLRTSVYIFSFAMFASLLVNIPRYFVDIHQPGDLGGFGIIIMPATMLNLFVQFVIQPKLVPLSKRFADKDFASFGRTVRKLILVSLGFGVIATAAAWLIGCPVLTLIFGEDLYMYRVGLTLVVLGGTVNTMTMIYSNILSVMRKFGIQLFNYLAATVGIFIACAVLVVNGSVDGAFFAFLIANAIQAVLFFISYQVIFRRLRG